jgi:hypothetical protein
VGLVDNEYPSGSSMSASVIICIVLLGLIPKIEPTLFGLARILQDAPATCNIVFKSFATSHACKFSYIFSSKTLTILRTHGTCFRGFRSARLVQRY